MPVMSSHWEKQAISRLVKDSILQLCKSHQVYGGQVEIDGIICITGKSEGQEIVVKVHEKIGGYEGRLALTDFLTRPRDGWTSILSSSRGEDDAEDYSIKRQRLDDSSFNKTHEADSYPNLKQHLMTPSHMRDIREIHDFRNHSNSRENHQQSAKDLSMSTSAMDMTPSSPPEPLYNESPNVSPGGVNDSIEQSPNSPHHSGRYPFTSTPHSIFPKRIPLRSDRWSPNQPLPTVPECKPCGYTFNNFEILSDHNEAVHSVFTCQCCYKTFTSRSNLERHSRLHTGHRPYSCTICGKTFSRKDHLSNHATKHAYKCGTCSKRFSDKKMLVTHYSYDHNAILTNICDFCNKGFSSNEQYEEHLKVHPQCGGKMDDDDCIPQNLSTSSNHSPADTKYLCKVCGFSTADKLTLLKHQIIHQDNTRCYTCLSCAKMFDDPLRYSDHLFVHVNDTNIFECCICRQVCPSLSSLCRHESTHLSMCLDDEDDDDSRASSPAIASYACSKCNKSFASQFNLDEHMELHQKTESGFACTVCHEEFENYSEICTHIEQEGHYVYPAPSENGTTPTGGSSSSKNKRKQNIPKAVKHVDELEQESDLEIVEPECPEDINEENSPNMGAAGYITHTSNGEFVVTENPASVIEIKPDNLHDSPVKRILSQAIQARVRDIRPELDQENHNEQQGSSSVIESILANHKSNTSPPHKRSKQRSPEKAPPAAGSEANNNSTNNNNNMLLSPKLMNVDIPAGPYTCSICSSVITTFQELEMHCFSEHNRSPCMFCSKTFAQKANRDRHVCLHTGEKPYGCPECNEKFSRGDKLKIHRMRSHQTAFPSIAGKSKDPSLRDLSMSPSVSPTGSQDSSAFIIGVDAQEEWSSAVPTAHPSENMYSAGEWAVKGGATNQYVPATGEWSISEEMDQDPPSATKNIADAVDQ